SDIVVSATSITFSITLHIPSPFNDSLTLACELGNGVFGASGSIDFNLKVVSALPHAVGSVSFAFAIRQSTFYVSGDIKFEVATFYKNYPFDLPFSANAPLSASALVDVLWDAIKKAVEGIL